MEDLKRSKKHCIQLLILFGFDIFNIQPNFITKSIVFRLNTFIIGLLLKFLDMVLIFFINNHQFFLFC